MQKKLFNRLENVHRISNRKYIEIIFLLAFNLLDDFSYSKLVSMHFIKIFFRSHCTCESKGCKNLSVTAVSKLIIEEMKIDIVPCYQVKVGLVDL